MMQQTSAEQDQIRPVQFLTRGELEQLPIPLIRITTCGLLTVEVAEEIVSLDPPLVRYISLTPEQLQGRGTVPAFTLLKLLLNRHERFADHEWLMEQFCCEEELFSSKRINNIVSQLRNLLCSSTLPALQALRMQIVAHVRSSGSSGYQLAAFPLIWVDQDALIWNVEQATCMERFNDPALALSFWERAYELARRGPYLPDEIYADWSRRQRGEAEGALRQSVQALARLYQEQQGATGEEEALRLLRSYWLEHPHEEDALRILMELLGKRECTHEALEYYEQLCTILKEDEREPDSQTRDIAQYLRNKQIKRSEPTILYAQEYGDIQRNSRQKAQADLHSSSVTVSQDGNELALKYASFFQPATDVLSERLQMALTQHHLPDTGTVQYLHQRVQHYWDQRQIAKLGTTLIPYVVEDINRVIALLEGPCLADMRRELSLIVGNLAMLLGELFYECNSYSIAQKYYRTAAIAAYEANDPSLGAVVYGRSSLTWIYQNQLPSALASVQHAKQQAGRDERIITWLAAIEAEIHARFGNEADCLASLQKASRLHNLSNQESFHWIHFDPSLLAGYEGACFLRLKKPAEAYQSLTQAITGLDTTTKRRRPRLLIDLAEAYIQQQEIEAACETLLAALLLLHVIYSPVTVKRLLVLRSQLQPWQNLATVQTLDETLIQLQGKQRIN